MIGPMTGYGAARGVEAVKAAVDVRSLTTYLDVRSRLRRRQARERT